MFHSLYTYMGTICHVYNKIWNGALGQIISAGEEIDQTETHRRDRGGLVNCVRIMSWNWLFFIFPL